MPEEPSDAEEEKDAKVEEIGAPFDAIPDTGSWVISTTRGTSCLHVVGNCHRIPGLHYHGWSVVDKNFTAGRYRKACKTCFSRGFPLVDPSPFEMVQPEMEDGMPEEFAADEGSESTSDDESV